MQTTSQETHELPRDPGAGALARSLLDPYLDGFDEVRARDARLLATELVANALEHGRGDVQLMICDDGERLRVEVVDAGGGPTSPHVAATRAQGDGGYGLLLVERLADEWGSARGSTHVWFEMRR